MRRAMIRYRVKPDQVERNEELVRAVYEELHGTALSGFRYATFRLDDGVSFVHLYESEGEENELAKLDAFKEFQEGIADRCDEPPVATKLAEIGSFRFS
jgi:hypothetical protein